jgi:excinuclease ABC subunit C
MHQTIQSLPSQAGVYQYFDARGKLLYVGKAKNLKNRVKSYWRFTPELHPNPTLGARITKMLTEATSLEYLIVESEEDALILENSLIKQLHPKYNILLRDDKTYPYIYIDESQAFPRFELTRKVVKGEKIRYYGPFPTGGRALLDALYEIYPLVQKRSGLDGGKACLFHQIGKCLAPCEQKITSDTYHEVITEIKHAIKHRSIIQKKLETRMMTLAQQERYEEAGKIRDQIEMISTLKIHSSIDLAKQDNIDIFAIIKEPKRGVIIRMFMREGKIISSSHNFFAQTDHFDTDEAYRQVILDFYSREIPSIPREILVAEPFASMHEVAHTLSKTLAKRLQIKYPQRGDKQRLIQLAHSNARELLKQHKRQPLALESALHSLLALSRLPLRVEAFDNSHMMGVAAVGAMVVWSEGVWDKSSYRRYTLTARDEYGQMTEMLQRRISNFDTQPPPDLWILDGGQANLNLAIELLATVGVNLDVIAIAKEKLDSKAHRAKGAAKDILYTPQGKITLSPSDKRLQWCQRLRDESHRFVITYHQNKKRREDTQISLLEKKGIGKATVKKLLDYFGTFENIENASYQELLSVTNKSIATILVK